LNVKVQRDLEKADPGAHLPDLALSLYAWSSRLTALGRPAESLAAAEEACAISRQVGDPISLTRTLTALGVRLAEVGRGDEAVAAAAEAIDIQRNVPPREASWPHLAGALWGYGFVSVKAGKPSAHALAVADEAIAIYDTAARRSRNAFTQLYGGELAAAYSVRADLLEALGRAREAAKLRRKLGRRPFKP
jgi:tetratricopeptide (TPR) repeat protein